jgi:hypothetical protein
MQVVLPFASLHHAERGSELLSQHKKQSAPTRQGRSTMSHVIYLASEMSRTDISIRPMTAMRAVLLCLTALFTTAIWGAILHFGTRALGIPIGAGWLAVVLTVIFLMLLLALSMAVVASDRPDDDKLGPPPGA